MCGSELILSFFFYLPCCCLTDQTNQTVRDEFQVLVSVTQTHTVRLSRALFLTSFIRFYSFLVHDKSNKPTSRGLSRPQYSTISAHGFIFHLLSTLQCLFCVFYTFTWNMTLEGTLGRIYSDKDISAFLVRIIPFAQYESFFSRLPCFSLS